MSIVKELRNGTKRGPWNEPDVYETIIENEYSANNGGRTWLAIQNTMCIFAYVHKYEIDLRVKWIAKRLISKIPNVKCFQVFFNLEKIWVKFYETFDKENLK